MSRLILNFVLPAKTRDFLSKATDGDEAGKEPRIQNVAEMDLEVSDSKTGLSFRVTLPTTHADTLMKTAAEIGVDRVSHTPARAGQPSFVHLQLADDLQIDFREREPETGDSAPRTSRRIFVRTTAEKAFQALLDVDLLRKWFQFVPPLTVEAKLGGAYVMGHDGAAVIEGNITKFEPPHRLDYTFRFAGSLEPESVVSWQLTEAGNYTRIDFSHRGLDLSEGWDQLLSIFKTFLETGEAPPLSEQ